MTRGDVYWARLETGEGSEQAGRRPAIIVSRDAINKFSPVVIIVPLSRRRDRKHFYPSQIEVPAGVGGLTSDSVAQCEQVRAIAKTRLLEPMGHLPSRVMAEINDCLKIALDIP